MAKRISAFAVLIVMVLTIAIGYAALVDTLTVSGSGKYEPEIFEGVFISEVQLVSSSGISGLTYSHIMPTNLQVSGDPSSTSGSATFKVTFTNNTNYTHWYLGQKLDTSYGQNSLVGAQNGITVRTKDKQGDNSATFTESDWIPANTSRDVYITYTFGSAAQNAINTLINFDFGIKVDAVHDEFLAVLNNIMQEDSYDYLSGIFDEQYDKNGSVTIDSINNPEVFASLFEDLNVNIDGQEKEATVLIRRENIDGRATGDGYSGGGPSGCEYTLYITFDDTSPATVYAITYTLGSASANGQWSQLGELYDGTASLNADGSINYKTWIANANTYTLASVNGNTITYKVGQKNGDQYDIKKTIEDITSVADQNFYNSIDNIGIFKTIYEILKKHPNSTDPAVANLAKTFEEASPYYEIRNNGQEFKAVRNYTRAEVIPVIEGLYNALQYYYQAYPS